jgi:hypothetical protein
MVMKDNRTWVIGAAPSGVGDPCLDIDILANESGTGSKVLIESSDFLKRGSPKGEVRSLDQARWDEGARRQLLALFARSYGNPVIRRVMEQDSPADEPQVRVLFKTRDGRIKEVLLRVTVVISEGDHLAVRRFPPAVPGSTEAGERFVDPG